MSKHKKKKPNVHHLEKVAKAQHKNEYLRKIRKVLDAIGCSHVLAMMPANELDFLYDVRCRAINISIEKGDVMLPGKLKWIRRLISAMLKRYEVQLIKDGKSVDLDTFFSAGITLTWYGSMLEYETYPKAREVKDALITYALDKQYKNTAFIHLRNIASTTSLMLSDITKRIYWATVKLNIDNEKSYAGFHMKWHSTPAEKFYAKINGESHLAYRLGHPEYQKGPVWVSISDMNQKLPDCKLKKQVDVYVQAHALKRLSERNDCITREIVMSELIRSLENAKMQYYPDSSRILIDFCLYGVKTGYLLASIAGNKLVIRTYLFITLNGSPEGSNLRRIARLKKNDIPFLELDRLSTFMTKEIQENRHIKQFFVDAGLKPLFDLYKILKDMNITITRHPNTTLIEDFLGIDLTKEFLEEDEEEDDDDEPFDEEFQTDDDRDVDDKNHYEEKLSDTVTLATTEAQAKPAKTGLKSKMILWGTGIVMGVITYLIRIIDLPAAHNARYEEKIRKNNVSKGVNSSNRNAGYTVNNRKNNKPDSGDDEPIDKDNKFSSTKLSLPGKIFGWIIVTLVMLTFTIVTMPYNYIRQLIKGKKAQKGRLDYRQFLMKKRRKGK